MPWNGLNETGARVCDEQLDNAPIGAFMGQSLWVPEAIVPANRYPKIALGTSDFTMEWVMRFRDGDPSLGFSDIPHYSGFLNPDTVPFDFVDIIIGQQFLPGPAFALQSFSIDYDGTPFGGTAGGTTFIAWPAPQTAFVHVAATFDRSALLEGWVNGVKDLLDPTDISADVAVSIPALLLHPFIGETNFRSDFDALDEDPTGVNANKLFMTGFAIHNRLLTPAEILANSNALTVGDYGSAVTLVRYDFTKLVDASGNLVAIEKEPLLENIGIGQKWTVPDPYDNYLFGVKGKNDTLFIEDSSGNGNHVGLETQESYGNAALDERCIVGFSSLGAM